MNKFNNYYNKKHVLLSPFNGDIVAAMFSHTCEVYSSARTIFRIYQLGPKLLGTTSV